MQKEELIQELREYIDLRKKHEEYLANNLAPFLKKSIQQSPKKFGPSSTSQLISMEGFLRAK
jgi:hypothetical protein